MEKLPRLLTALAFLSAVSPRLFEGGGGGGDGVRDVSPLRVLPRPGKPYEDVVR